MTKPRLSASMTLQMQTWAKKRPWLVVLALLGRTLFGAALMVFAGVMLWKGGSSAVWLTVAAVGSLPLPGIPEIIASKSRKYIAAWQSFRAAKKEPSGEEDRASGGAGTPSNGSSP